MATTILEIQTLSNFVDEEGSRVYLDYTESPIFVVGATYHVHWDGTVYTCVAQAIDAVPALGNVAVLGGEDTGEPFLMGTIPGEFIGEESNEGISEIFRKMIIMRLINHINHRLAGFF